MKESALSSALYQKEIHIFIRIRRAVKLSIKSSLKTQNGENDLVCLLRYAVFTKEKKRENEEE